jgi:hypothetical protein
MVRAYRLVRCTDSSNVVRSGFNTTMSSRRGESPWRPEGGFATEGSFSIQPQILRYAMLRSEWQAAVGEF